MVTKKLVFPVVAIALLGGSYFAVAHANAQTPTENPMSGLVQAIAQKFNLNQSEVQSVVDDWHTKKHDEMKDMMQQRLSERLDEAVKEGKLTEAQKQALITKLSEFHQTFDKEVSKDMTPEERMSEMEKKKTELEEWAKSQGIDLSFLPQILHGPKMGMRVMHHFNMTTPTPSQ